MTTNELLKGPIAMTKKGMDFFKVRRQSSRRPLIPAQWTNHALAGDMVKVAPMGDYRDPMGRMPPRASGKVVEIISRARRHSSVPLSNLPPSEVGVPTGASGKDKKIMLAPDYKKMYVPIVVTETKGAELGFKVTIEQTAVFESPSAGYTTGAVKGFTQEAWPGPGFVLFEVVTFPFPHARGPVMVRCFPHYLHAGTRSIPTATSPA